MPADDVITGTPHAKASNVELHAVLAINGRSITALLFNVATYSSFDKLGATTAFLYLAAIA